MGIEELDEKVAAVVAESRFSGVVRVDVGGETVLAQAHGWAHRAHGVPMEVDTRLGTASATKAAGDSCTCALSVYSGYRWMNRYWALECNGHASHGVCFGRIRRPRPND